MEVQKHDDLVAVLQEVYQGSTEDFAFVRTK